MREPAIIRLLPDRRRLHLHDGPIDLIIEATGMRRAVRCRQQFDQRTNASPARGGHRFQTPSRCLLDTTSWVNAFTPA